MSRSLGASLPDDLLARLTALPGAVLADRVVVLLSVDPYGWPHPALVSYAELLGLDAHRLRLGLHARSRSSAHLREVGRATLVFADPELLLYVKAEALALPVAPTMPELARFELVVREVLADRAEGDETGARLTGGLTVVAPGSPGARVARLSRLRGALSD